jgi:hypothetical protein
MNGSANRVKCYFSDGAREDSELDPHLLNLDVWPTVAEDAIKEPQQLETYRKRRSAIRLLVAGGLSTRNFSEDQP